jgi:acetyl esterase/lipase
MNRLLFLISCAAVAAVTAIALTTPRVERDIPYAEPKNERQLLDIVWVHGGGWMRGSKNEMEHKPSAFVEGFVFVPVNYRFAPHVTMGTIVRDVAKAAGWCMPTARVTEATRPDIPHGTFGWRAT